MRQDARGGGSATNPPAPGQDARHGYQWKTLFLPEGTQLRMTVSHHTYHAQVVGDAIVYQGRPVSPRGLTVAIAGEGRNAWRDLWIKFPEDRYWKGANRCRIEAHAAQAQAQALAAQAQPQPSAGENMRVAAAAMVQALNAALELVKHSCAGQQQDRRNGQSRRESDVLSDSCAFD